MSVTNRGLMTRIAASGALVAMVLGGSTLAVSANSAPEGATAAVQDGSEFVVDVTPENHDKVVTEGSKNHPVIVMFSTAGCQPCTWLKPILKEKAAADKKWTLALLDGVKYQDLWKKYNTPWFPTIVAVRDGSEVARHGGYDKSQETKIRNWVDTFVAGGVPGVENSVVELNSKTEKNIMEKVSWQHPVITLFNADDATHKQWQEMIVKMNKGDQGRWTLAINSGTPAEKKAMEKKYGVTSRPTMHTYFRGVKYFDLKGRAKEQVVRDYVLKSVTSHYPDLPETPEPPRPTVTTSPTTTSRPTATTTSTPRPPAGDLIQDVNTRNHDAIVASSKDRVVVMELGGPGCQGCEMLKPVMHDLALADANFTLANLDITADEGKNMELWAKYGEPLLPTLIAFRDGKEVTRTTGYNGDKERVTKWVRTFTAGGVPNDPGPDFK